jgi:hypothetical protein
VVPVLEEVDSIDELKEAIEHPMAFLDRISKAGAESLGIAISASLRVLKVVPGGQGAQKHVQVGDIISRVGSTDLSYDGRMQMDVKVDSLLSDARMRGEAFVMIEFNDGAKGAEFKIKSRLTAATRQIMDPTLEEENATVVGVASPALATKAATRPTSAAADGDSGFHVEHRCPSPVDNPIEDGRTVEEQREQERRRPTKHTVTSSQTSSEEREQEKAAAARQIMNPTLEEESATVVGVASLFAEIREEVTCMTSQETGQDGNIPTSVVPIQAEAAAQLKPLPNQRIQPTLSAAVYGEDIDIDTDTGGGGYIENV